MMGLHKDRHGTYYARHKVPLRLQAAVAQVLGNGKSKQVWLKRSLGTKKLSEANVRGKPVQIEFDRIIAEAEGLLKQRPVRSGLSDIEIKRIADYFYANELAADEEVREDTRGSDPLYASIHRQLAEASVDTDAAFDPTALTLEPGQGLSPRMMAKIENDNSVVLAAAQRALARGDVSFIRYELNALLEVFQINLDPSSPSYRKLARAVTEAQVKACKAVLARHKGEPVATPPLLQPSDESAVTSGTLRDALLGWQKERNPSPGVMAEYERAIRLFGELHGDLPVVHIKRTHARSFREALQDVPRQRAASLGNAALPDLAEWGRQHPSAQKISAPTVNKLLGGVQTICLWASKKGGLVPDEIPWADPFARMRLPEDPPERDAFTIGDLNCLFASRIFTRGERPLPGRGEAAYWLPLLGLYTGARRGELAALRAKDIQKVDGVFAFTFVEDKVAGKSLKTRTSARTVPVHPQLTRLGWLSYVNKVRRECDENAWLLPKVAPGVPGAIKAWTKWFNRHLRAIGISDKRKVFHSFRHTFKDALRTARVQEDLNDALTGHSNATVGRRYGAKEIVRRFGMDALREAVGAVDYRGLKLPSKGNKRKERRT
jgi:integrase